MFLAKIEEDSSQKVYLNFVEYLDEILMGLFIEVFMNYYILNFILSNSCHLVTMVAGYKLRKIIDPHSLFVIGGEFI